MKHLFFVLFGLLLASGAGASDDSNGPLTFGVVPQQAPEKLARQWVPLMRYLSEETGREVRFATAPSIPEFEQRMAAGAYDIAYMNPYHFTVFHESPGYRALARQKDHTIKGILVVAKDAPVDTIEALQGQSLAFPAPRAFAATLITRAALDQAAPGYQASFVRSHDSVYRAVADGLFLAGGGIVRTFREMEPDVRSRLRILWQSDGYTGHAIASHPALPEVTRSAIVEALVAVDDTERGRSLLTNLGMKGFQQATGSDWDDVRRLNIRIDP